MAQSRSRSKKRFQPKDFLLAWGEEKARPGGARQTWQEQKMIAMMFAAASEKPERGSRGKLSKGKLGKED